MLSEIIEHLEKKPVNNTTRAPYIHPDDIVTTFSNDADLSPEALAAKAELNS